MTTDLDIQAAICEILLGTVTNPMLRTDGSHVVPQSTITTSTVGGTSMGITAADPSIFTIGSSVSFADDLAEERLYVASGSGGTPWNGGNPIPLDFTLRGYSALQQSHTAGTVVYTNLFDTTPWDIASGLGKGAPVIFVRAMQAGTRLIAVPSGNYTTLQVDIQLHRLLNNPTDTDIRINPNAWADKQERLSREDVGLITTALLANEKLIGNNHPARTLQMAPLNTNGDKITTRWRSQDTAGDTTHLYAVLTAVYVVLA